MLVVLPEIALPDFCTELVMRTPVKEGTVDGGEELETGLVDQGPAQAAGGVLVEIVTSDAKPLNAAGAPPPERLLSDAQPGPHQVVSVVGPALPAVMSPSVKAP